MRHKFSILLLSGVFCLLVFSLAKAQTQPDVLDYLSLAQSTSTSPMAACPTDDYEPNGDIASAAAMPLGSPVSAYICPDRDQDFFVFAVDEPTEIEVQLFDLPRDYQLALFNPDGTIVARAGGIGTTPRRIHYRATTFGDYRVRVMAGSTGHEVEPYNLRVDLTDLSPITHYAVADTTISEAFPDDNYGNDLRIIVSKDEFGQEHRGLFRFDLSGVPRTEIASASFRMALADDGAARPLNVGLYRATESWDEETVTWNNQPSAPIYITDTAVGGLQGRYYDWDVTELVRSWLTGTPNHGFMLRVETGDGSRSFTSRVRSGMFIVPGAGSSRSPTLIIRFVEESGRLPGSIRGSVYDDVDGDGRHERGEPGIENVRVELFREHVGRGTQLTAFDGTFNFTGLSAGEYEVQVRPVSLPVGWELTSSEIIAVDLSWGEHLIGRNFTVEDRSPPPPPAPTLNLHAAGWDFIQVVNGEQLIAGKPTLVRLYVETNEPAADISANLYHNEHMDDPLEPITPANVSPDAADRPWLDPAVVEDMDRTINFLLPDAWTTPGLHDFHLILNEDEEVPECRLPRPCYNNGNEIERLNVRFRETDNHRVIMAHLDIGGVRPDTPLVDVYGHLHTTYPISDMDVISTTIPLAGINLTVPIAADDGCGPEWREVLDGLADSGIFTSISAIDPTWYIYGMIDESIPHNTTIDGDPKTINGCGYTSEKQAAGIVHPPPPVAVEPGDHDFGDRTMAHETGHNYGLEHVCSVFAEPDCRYQRPGGSIGEYGVDLRDPARLEYLDPVSSRDIMTSGFWGLRRWISDLTFRDLLAVLGTAALTGSEPAALPVPEREYIVVAGHLLNGVVTVPRPYYQLKFPAGSHDGPGSGPYSIELRDATGKALFTRRFETAGDSMSAEWPGRFQEILPWMPATRNIVIKEGNRVLHARLVSPNTPEVKLFSPKGGEHWLANGRYTISWIARDTDGDHLRYALQYSPDGGQTWRAIATNLTKTKYTVEAKTLPGGEEGVIRVTASDGVNTAQDQNDILLTVEGKPASVEIISPRDGFVYEPGMPLILRGIAIDLEDGSIKDDSRYRWTSSLEGELGIGRSLYFDYLRPGRHTITLSVTDSDDFTSSTSSDIAITHQTHLPLVLKK